MKKRLYKRKIIDEIEKYIETEDIVVLHGARQVGKTHILYYLKQEFDKKTIKNLYIDLEDSRFAAILDQGVRSFLNLIKEEGFDLNEKIIVLIDEIQYLKNPSAFLKLIADHHKKIKLIVSGSSSFDIKNKFKDSLVGRTVNFEVFNLSFEEFLDFKGYHFDVKKIYTEKKTEELKDFFREYTLYGGYPKIVLTDGVEKKEKYLQQIVDTYVKKDIRDLAKIRDIEKFNKLLEVLASQSGNLLNITEISNTCRISKATVERYLFIMENTYILKIVRPYSKNIRSELFRIPKVFFYDSGLMQILWLKNLQRKIIGNVFETAVFSELVKKYRQENIFFWRTTDKKEVDFIVKTASGALPIEVKINSAQFNKKHIAYFMEKYKIKKGYFVALEGELTKEDYIYPWAI